MLTALLAYLTFAFLTLVGPGVAAQRLARVQVDAALVLPLGMALCAGVYWLSLALGAPWAFLLVVGALDLSLALPPRPSAPVAGRATVSGALPPLLAVVALLAVTQYPLNRKGADGSFLLDPMGDHPLHVGITRELAIGYPPEVPGLAGVRLSYHYGADLVRAAALRWAGVDPYDCISRFEVTLVAFSLILVFRAAAHQLGWPPLAVALAPWTLLATDFSFLLAAWFAPVRWWTDLLRGNVLISLAFDNPVVPALALAVGSLVALARYEKGDGAGWWGLSAIQAAAVPWFKVFLGAQLLLGLLVATLLARGRARLAAAGLALCTLPGLLALFLSPAGQAVEVSLAPLEMVVDSLANVGVSRPAWPALLAWTPLWLAASLGLRLVGIPLAFRALRLGSALAAALGAMALSGWPLGLLFRASARDMAGRPLPSATIYFVEQAGCLLWLFAAAGLARMIERRGHQGLFVIGAAAVCLPSTLEFAWEKSREPVDPLPPAMVRAMTDLEAATHPGDVVLQRPGGRYPPAPVLLVGRRVPYERFTPYLTQFAPRVFLAARHEEVYRFFRTPDRGEALALAHRLEARAVCLYGSDRLRFEGRGDLEAIHDEPDARCYRLPP